MRIIASWPGDGLLPAQLRSRGENGLKWNRVQDISRASEEPRVKGEEE